MSVPRAAASLAPGSTAAAERPWEPPSEPRGFARTGGTCSDCHAPVMTEPRGTALWCSGCKSAVTPPAVLAPYRRGAEVTRAAKSQRERDLEALALARRKGTMGAQLAALADDERLTPDSAAVVAWFAEQVKAAASGARLDELVELFAEAGIRRRRFWQGRPAALSAGDDEDNDEDQDEPAAILATPAAVTGQQRPPARATWADALALLGYQLDGTAAACAVTGRNGRNCGQPTGGSPPVTDASGGSGWVCPPHYNELGRAIAAVNRNRGIS